MADSAATPSSTTVDAIGYAGGAVLAACLVPQVAKIIIVRSARDISIAWSVLYLAGLSLSITYLVMKDAMAAWIPMVVEVVGCLLILLLKLFFERTEVGRRFSAAARAAALLDASTHSLATAGRAEMLSMRGSPLPDISMHGGTHGGTHGKEGSHSARHAVQQHTDRIALEVVCSSESTASSEGDASMAGSVL